MQMTHTRRLTKLLGVSFVSVVLLVTGASGQALTIVPNTNAFFRA